MRVPGRLADWSKSCEWRRRGGAVGPSRGAERAELLLRRSFKGSASSRRMHGAGDDSRLIEFSEMREVTELLRTQAKWRSGRRSERSEEDNSNELTEENELWLQGQQLVLL